MCLTQQIDCTPPPFSNVNIVRDLVKFLEAYKKMKSTNCVLDKTFFSYKFEFDS